jgi:3'(2'), 5'-bisphosphate nucleotidase
MLSNYKMMYSNSSESYQELLRPVIQIAYQAGRRILEIYDAGFEVEEKSDNTPLTEADLAADKIITQGLQDLTPGIPILTEESDLVPFKERENWPLYWLVDPLDGTREFIKRSGEFSVNIALVKENTAVLGVIYAPVMGCLYYASKGEGAFKKSELDDPVEIGVRKCPKKIVVAGSRSHQTKEFTNFLKKLPDSEIMCVGSALKSCLVAEGVADIYPRLGPTSEWDTAAAQCIVEEAGGHITDTKMHTLQYNLKDVLLNPHFIVFGDDSVDWFSYL